MPWNVLNSGAGVKMPHVAGVVARMFTAGMTTIAEGMGINMNTKLNLYVTDWAPNGTNDLLICNEAHEIIHVVEQATFGIDVMKHRSPVNDLVATEDQVISVKRGTDIPPDWTLVRAVTVKYLSQKLCVSPVDPSGARLIKRLKDAGIEVEHV